MLDMKFIRNNVDKVKAAIEQKNDIAEVDKLIEYSTRDSSDWQR